MGWLRRKERGDPGDATGRRPAAPPAGRASGVASEAPRDAAERNGEIDRLFAYHEATKHSHASVHGGGWSLDWANQPNSFRRYAGAPRVGLPPPDPLLRPSASACMAGLADTARRAWPERALPLVSSLLHHSMAVSAWKQVVGTEVRYSLRVNPSSGNLHPTETWLALAGLPAAGRDLDLGSRVHGHFPDEALEEVMALTGGDERPLLLLDLRDIDAAGGDAEAGDDATRHVPAAPLGAPSGTPNVPSTEALGWPLIDGMHASTLVDGGPCPVAAPAPDPPGATTHARGNAAADPPGDMADARGHAADPRPDAGAVPVPIALPPFTSSTARLDEVVRARRSAIDYLSDGHATLAEFAAILADSARMPRCDMLGNLDGGAPRRLVSLYCYVHRVADLAPGCCRYLPESHALLPVRMGDVRNAAAGLSLGQDLAGHAIAAFSMIADLERGAAAFGNRAYRHAHVAAGMLGQGLYLAATARGQQSTGIGARPATAGQRAPVRCSGRGLR